MTRLILIQLSPSISLSFRIIFIIYCKERITIKIVSPCLGELDFYLGTISPCLGEPYFYLERLYPCLGEFDFFLERPYLFPVEPYSYHVE